MSCENTCRVCNKTEDINKLSLEELIENVKTYEKMYGECIEQFNLYINKKYECEKLIEEKYKAKIVKEGLKIEGICYKTEDSKNVIYHKITDFVKFCDNNIGMVVNEVSFCPTSIWFHCIVANSQEYCKLSDVMQGLCSTEEFNENLRSMFKEIESKYMSYDKRDKVMNSLTEAASLAKRMDDLDKR